TDRADAGETRPRRAAGQPATSATDGGGGDSSAQAKAGRLAAGHMPPPVYPAEARRRGQTGTLLVEFTVDAAGRVIAASAVTPSPWPLLNQEAVSAVRRWTFPPGSVMKLQRPIVFQLR
ncbi:MAG: energy transducer TonB, partial [Verrucomicrobiota bacterium]